MARQRKAKKSLIKEIKKTLHSLTKPKRTSNKRKSRKTRSTKTVTKTKAESTKEFQIKLEHNITRKISEDMQKIKQEMEQELLEKLTSKKSITNSDEEGSPDVKKTRERKGTKDASNKSAKSIFKPKTDCTFLKSLTLSDSQERTVVVGYEVLDNSNQEIWGINIHEGAKLARTKKILNTKVKSRKAGSERQYFLVHEIDETLYYSDAYAKAALERGKLTMGKYTYGLSDAIKEAYDSGFKNDSNLPKI